MSCRMIFLMSYSSERSLLCLSASGRVMSTVRKRVADKYLLEMLPKPPLMSNFLLLLFLGLLVYFGLYIYDIIIMILLL